MFLRREKPRHSKAQRRSASILDARFNGQCMNKPQTRVPVIRITPPGARALFVFLNTQGNCRGWDGQARCYDPHQILRNSKISFSSKRGGSAAWTWSATEKGRSPASNSQDRHDLLQPQESVWCQSTRAASSFAVPMNTGAKENAKETAFVVKETAFVVKETASDMSIRVKAGAPPRSLEVPCPLTSVDPDKRGLIMHRLPLWVCPLEEELCSMCIASFTRYRIWRL
ncbi:hypothetical protein EV126DRAFT_426215 [Verticillium dahliae]|nr:hypothetical protein EV126DRAFT_426215 [Verticillium dahliae]